MKCIEQLKIAAATVGATLDENTDYSLNLDAPSGYVWIANRCTCIHEQAATNSQSWYSQAVKSVIESASMGLMKVTDPKEIAEMRHLLDDDSWGAAGDAPDKLEWA